MPHPECVATPWRNYIEIWEAEHLLFLVENFQQGSDFDVAKLEM